MSSSDVVKPQRVRPLPEMTTSLAAVYLATVAVYVGAGSLALSSDVLTVSFSGSIAVSGNAKCPGSPSD